MIQKILFGKPKGVSIIAAIFIIVVLAFMGVMFVSLLNTSGFSAINDMQSTQAFYIAEGGLQYTLGLNKNNMPNYSTHGAWISLGTGQFKVDTPAYLPNAVAVGATSISVDSTDSFPATGRITIDNEFIQYTGKNDVTDTFTLNPANPVTAAHSQFNAVYPATKLSAAIASDPACNPLPAINIEDDTSGFQIPGIIFIDTEYFYCMTRSPISPFPFQNCQRCYADSDPAAHPSTRFASQYTLTSTGRVPSIAGNAERVIRINAGPHEE